MISIEQIKHLQQVDELKNRILSGERVFWEQYEKYAKQKEIEK